jgi:hypothetical protein
LQSSGRDVPFLFPASSTAVVRTLVATSAAIGLVLVAVFVVLSMDARNRIAGTPLRTSTRRSAPLSTSNSAGSRSS